MAVDPKLADANSSQAPARNVIFLLLIFLLIALVMLLLWRNSSLGRSLSDKQISEYLHDTKDPRHMQDALVQVGTRMQKHEAGVSRWYPDLVSLSSSPVEEVRNTDARVMGEDTSAAEFHAALLKMLNDSCPSVRGNAALSLVDFGDPSGRSEILALLQPATITAPSAGKVVDAGAVGTAVRQDGLVARLDSNGQDIDVRSPINGRVQTSSVKMGETIAAGAEIAVVDPEGDQVWGALHALAEIGQQQDIPIVQHYERALPYVPKRVREQAGATETAIKARVAR